MKNFIELYKVLRGNTNTVTLAYLVSDYRQSIIDTVMKIKHNNTTRKAAVESYKKICNATRIDQDIKNGIMCDGVSAVSLSVKAPDYNPELGSYKALMEVARSTKNPAPLKESIDYAIATARVNGWTIGDNDFFIRVGDNKYNLTLVARIANMIADNNVYNGCNFFLAGDKGNILMMATKYGFGIVLPFINNAPGFYDVTPGESSFDKMIKDDLDYLAA